VAYNKVLREKQALQKMFARELAARQTAEDCEATIRIKLLDETDCTAASDKQVDQLRAQIAALESKLAAEALRTADEAAQGMQRQAQYEAECNAHEETEGKLDVTRGELVAERAMHCSLREEMSRVMARIDNDEDKSWMFRRVNVAVAAIITKLNRGLRLAASQTPRESPRGLGAALASVASNLPTPGSTVGARSFPGSPVLGATTAGASARAAPTKTPRGAAKGPPDWGGEDGSVWFDVVVEANDQGVQTAAVTTVQTAARRPKNFGHSAVLVEIERAAILQELIELYDLTAGALSLADDADAEDAGGVTQLVTADGPLQAQGRVNGVADRVQRVPPPLSFQPPETPQPQPQTQRLILLLSRSRAAGRTHSWGPSGRVCI
jgi:hypothetical protein